MPSHGKSSLWVRRVQIVYHNVGLLDVTMKHLLELTAENGTKRRTGRIYEYVSTKGQ